MCRSFVSGHFGGVRSNPLRTCRSRFQRSKHLQFALLRGTTPPPIFFNAVTLTTSFCSPARDTIVVGTADGSLHLIRPNSWRRYIRQIQAHKLYAATLTNILSTVLLTLEIRATTCVAVSGSMICSASLDKTISVVSIDYEVWFSNSEFCVEACAHFLLFDADLQ